MTRRSLLARSIYIKTSMSCGGDYDNSRMFQCLGVGVTVSGVADRLIAGYEPLDVQRRRTRVALARDTLSERAAALAKPLRRRARQEEEPCGLVLVQD